MTSAGRAAMRFRVGGVLALGVAIACGTPVGVSRVPPQQVHRSLTANVLSTGAPSVFSIQALNRRNLSELHRRDPDAALRALRAAMLAADDREELLFVLAELEFARGEQRGGTAARPHFLASAIYAFHLLKGLPSDEYRVAVDPRIRLAADLYNRGLTAGLASDDGETVDLSSRTLPLPFGRLVLEADPTDLLWGDYRMTDFVPVAELSVRGIRNRHRRPGLGAPLAASLEPAEEGAPPPELGRISELVRVPATAFVIFGEGDRALEGGEVPARLRLFTRDTARSIRIEQRELSLESEPTAALAFGIAEARPWEFAQRGFLSGDFGTDADRGVRMLAPYDPDRIPVVFIHGTASSTWRWAEMLNDLQADPVVFERYQLWLFKYNTGNPITFSAGLLRQDLEALVDELDPEGDDENLRRMVLVGHSQGGLLAKLCVVDSGDAFWRLVSKAPIDELDLQPETREVLERSLFFEPLPFVKSAVFIATPFRGSFLAERWYIRLITGMVSFSGELVDAIGDLVIADDDRVLLRSLDELPHSVQDMRADNRFLETLVEMPVAPGVSAHTIIAVSDPDPDPALAHDGVVSVKSQRLDGVETELVVESDHSTQRHPITIEEVARILRDAPVESAEPQPAPDSTQLPRSAAPMLAWPRSKPATETRLSP